MKKLAQPYQMFIDIAEEQKNFMQVKDHVWKELASNVRQGQQVALQTMSSKLDSDVKVLLSDMNEQVISRKLQLARDVEKFNEHYGALLENLQKGTAGIPDQDCDITSNFN